MRQYPDEGLCVSACKLFCSACQEELLLKKSIISQHLKSTKHSAGKDRLKKKEKRERDIAKSLEEYDKHSLPVGESLPEAVRVYRVKTVTAF